MPRLSRRLTTALLWLALALLPLRGLAAALMPAMGAVPPAATAIEVADAAESMPCHGAAADSRAEADAAPVDDCPTCSLCALCHASVAQATQFSLELPQLPSSPPATAPPSAIEPRAPDGLFRPPRTLGA